MTLHLPQDIPSTGECRWFDLEARSARSNVEGQIYLSLMLSTREDRGSGYNEEDNWTDLGQHKDLTGVLVDHELRKFKVSREGYDVREVFG